MKNQIADILQAQGVSKYRLHINMNALRLADTNARPISYKTVLSIVNSTNLPFATHFGNMYLIAKALGVSIDDLLIPATDSDYKE